jgi:hypothetical protein
LITRLGHWAWGLVKYRQQHLGAPPEVSRAVTSTVLLVRHSGAEPGLDFRSHDHALGLGVDHPTFHLGGAQARHGARKVLTGLWLAQGVAKSPPKLGA